MQITVDLLVSWGACYPVEELRALFGAKRYATLTEVANAEAIPLDDRLWVLCRALAEIDETAARLYAVESALTVAHLAGDDEDQAQYLGLMNDLMCVEDLPEHERAAAQGAAWDAGWGAARGAAWGAARDAAWGAAWGAACGAARAAAQGAAQGAALDAALDAALVKAIERCLDWLDL